MKHIKYLFVITEFVFLFAASACADMGSVFLDFDDIAPTANYEIPGNSSNGWVYSSDATNPNPYVTTSGWYNTNKYFDHSDVYDFVKYYRNGYNTAHMGFETYGFLEIDNTVAVKGNSLKVTVSGGRNSKGQHGKELFNKEKYLEFLKNGIDPVSNSGVKVGHPYLYFMNNTLNQGNIPFQQAKNKNRLSFYIKMPTEVTNNPGGPQNPQPSLTMSIGPFSGNGGHWYHNMYNRGGGWTRVLIDGHPVHNNAWHNASLYPYPSYSLRDMGVDYFNTMFAFYITFWPYEGMAIPPYNIWLDKIEFYFDPEPQNCETINSPAVTFHSDQLLFEIGFNDKYKGNKDSWSEYEVKYSFSPITNSNYDDATYAIIQDDPRFKGVKYNEKGFFKKEWPYYQAVWAIFKLNPGDEADLNPGTRVYFAIKDLSKRPYHKGTFDEIGDTQIVTDTGGKRRIDLIKRISFSIPFDGKEDAEIVTGTERKVQIRPSQPN